MFILRRRLIWLFITLICAIILLFVSFGLRTPQENNGELTEALLQKDGGGEASASKNIIVESPQIEVKGTEVILSNADGSVKMRIRSDYGVSVKGVVSIPFAEFELNFEGDRKLYFMAKFLTYKVIEDMAEVSGSLSGEITPLGQRFSAKRLVWDRRAFKVTIEKVIIKDPAFEVSAGKAEFDIKTGELNIIEGAHLSF